MNLKRRNLLLILIFFCIHLSAQNYDSLPKPYILVSSQTKEFTTLSGATKYATHESQFLHLETTSRGPIKYFFTPELYDLKPNEVMTWNGVVQPNLDSIPPSGTKTICSIGGTVTMKISTAIQNKKDASQGEEVYRCKSGNKHLCADHDNRRGWHKLSSMSKSESYNVALYSIGLTTTENITLNPKDSSFVISARGYPNRPNGIYYFIPETTSITFIKEENGKGIFKVNKDFTSGTVTVQYILEGVSYGRKIVVGR